MPPRPIVSTARRECGRSDRLSPCHEMTMQNPGDGRGARTLTCRVETLFDICARVGNPASARVPKRHARVRAPRGISLRAIDVRVDHEGFDRLAVIPKLVGNEFQFQIELRRLVQTVLVQGDFIVLVLFVGAEHTQDLPSGGGGVAVVNNRSIDAFIRAAESLIVFRGAEHDLVHMCRPRCFLDLIEQRARNLEK